MPRFRSNRLRIRDEYPVYKFYCMLAASCKCLDTPSHQLHMPVAACGFNMENRYNALADAEACA